jgi:hypothetical protein
MNIEKREPKIKQKESLDSFKAILAIEKERRIKEEAEKVKEEKEPFTYEQIIMHLATQEEETERILKKWEESDLKIEDLNRDEIESLGVIKGKSIIAKELLKKMGVTLKEEMGSETEYIQGLEKKEEELGKAREKAEQAFNKKEQVEEES